MYCFEMLNSVNLISHLAVCHSLHDLCACMFDTEEGMLPIKRTGIVKAIALARSVPLSLLYAAVQKS